MKICKWISFLVIICVICPVFVIYVGAEENVQYGIEQKTYCNATIENDFADDCVLVVMTNKESLELKNYEVSDFSDVKIKSVADLSTSKKSRARRQLEIINVALKNRTSLENENIESYKEYNQILCLKLEKPGKENVLEAISILEKREDILHVEPSYYLKSYDLIPDEQFYNLQSNYFSNIELQRAWDITTGSSSVLVGIIDGGIDGDHEALQDNIDISLSRRFDGSSILNDNSVSDFKESSHGTRIAGIIGAQGNDGVGICGICWNVTLVSLNVYDQQEKTGLDEVVAAIDYADDIGIQILNMSLGGSQDVTDGGRTMFEAIQDYRGLFVCAAGNINSDNDNRNEYPGNYNSLPNVITVGGSNTLYDQKWSTSNYGKTKVDIFAPGGNIWTTIKNNDYEFSSGTSFAAPIVAGVAALLLSIHPELTAAQLKQIIMNSVDVVYDEDGNNVFGDLCVSGGRLNAYKALITPSIHSFDEVDNGNSSKHNIVCTECGYVSSTETHSLIKVYSGNSSTHDYICSDCGYVASTEEHSFVCENVNYEHIVICEDCDYIPPRAITYLNQGVASGHTASCSNCSYSATESHDWTDLSGSYRCLKCNVTTTTIPGIMSWEDEEETE